MKTRILMLLGLAVWSGCTSLRRDPDVALLEALEFGGAPLAVVAGLKGTSQSSGAFHGYNRVTDWRVVDKKTTADLAAVLAGAVRADLALARQPHKEGEATIWFHSFCFNPGYAVRLQSERGWREFLVCLECDEIYVFDDGGHAWNHHLENTEVDKLSYLLGG
jgi:hypothetical protein